MLNQNNECRICFEKEEEDNRFISPCLCSGTSKYVHYKCLETWRSTNSDTDAFYQCKECNANYKIENNYEQEQEQIYKWFRSTLLCYMLFISSEFISSLMIGFFDGINNFALIETLNFNQTYTLQEPTIIDFVKEDFFFNLAFYYSYASMLFSYLFYLYFFITTFRKIKRRRRYIRLMFPSLFSCCFYNTTFFPFYYYFTFSNLPSISLNFIFFTQFGQPYLISKLIKNHDIFIILMNVDNTGRVLNYYSDDDDIEALEQGDEKTQEYVFNNFEEKVDDPLLEVEICEVD